MKTNPEIRQEVREIIRGKWNAGVIVMLIYIFFQALFSILQTGGGEPKVGLSFVALLYNILVLLPLSVGVVYVFLMLAREGRRPAAEDMFKTFRGQLYGKVIILEILIAIFTFLWTLLLIVPGIIKGYSYMMAPYILLDNPNLTAMEAIDKSEEMTRGHKMDLFLMSLGMLGWCILSFVTLGIAMLWIIPYYQTVFAKFYLELKAEEEAKAEEAI